MKRDSKQVLTELLVLKAQTGDERAFADLYDLWAQDFLRFAWCKVKDRSGAEEVVQNTWIAISRGIGRVRDPMRFPNWAFSIVHRRAMDWIRRRQLDRTRWESVSGESANTISNQDHPVSERAAGLSEAIHRLGEGDQNLLQFFYNTGLSINEIGELLGIPAGTVKSRLFKIREKLKRYIESKNHE